MLNSVKIGLFAGAVAALLTYHIVSVNKAYDNGYNAHKAEVEQAEREAEKRADEVDDKIDAGADKVVKVIQTETIEVTKVDTRVAAENEANKKLVARLRKELESRDEEPSYEVTVCDPVELPYDRVQLHADIDSLLQDVR